MHEKSITNPPRAKRICQQCGLPFPCYPSRKEKFCSRACEAASRLKTPEQFWAQVQRGDGCWLWTGGVNRAGYGRTSWQGKVELAHRVAYLLMRGAWPEGVLHHTCETPLCVNPDHLQDLEIGDHVTNYSPACLAYRLAHADHCKHGHAFTVENTYVCRPPSNGGRPTRQCRECRRINDRKHKAKVRAARTT